MFDALKATEQDLIDGLKESFSFSHGSIDTSSPVNAPLLTNTSYTAVTWTLNATHTGDFVGLAPTGRAVVIEGVTIILVPQSDADDPQFMRFIDWSEVIGQLGVAMTGRPIVAD
jgi:hypothetical protein